MSEAGKVSLPMTPEQIEAYKAYAQINRGLSPEMAVELLAALEETQQQVKDLKEDRRKILAVHDEQCARSSEYYNELIFVKGKQAEAQQTIARLQAEKDTQSATIRRQQDTIDNQNAAWETDQQTIARQREGLEYYACAEHFKLNEYDEIVEVEDGHKARTALGEGAKEDGTQL